MKTKEFLSTIDMTETSFNALMDELAAKKTDEERLRLMEERGTNAKEIAEARKHFAAEERGADVTSIDLGVDKDNLQRDWVYNVRKPWKKDMAEFMERERKRRNAYWYAHKALKSKSSCPSIISVRVGFSGLVALT